MRMIRCQVSIGGKWSKGITVDAEEVPGVAAALNEFGPSSDALIEELNGEPAFRWSYDPEPSPIGFAHESTPGGKVGPSTFVSVRDGWEAIQELSPGAHFTNDGDFVEGGTVPSVVGHYEDGDGNTLNVSLTITPHGKNHFTANLASADEAAVLGEN
jgi:hypothetical protein